MQIVIITGMSGAGRTKAIRSLEDIGFYCVDNLPPVLLGKFIEMCSQSQGKLSKLAMVVDVRSGYMFAELDSQLVSLSKQGYKYEIAFLDCDDAVLIKRYKESRRNHPLSEGGKITHGIEEERKMLQKIKQAANYVIDTSNMTTAQLNKRIGDIFRDKNAPSVMNINVVSFGFKHGIPVDSDLMFDVRFMPNPFYVDSLKSKTGMDKEVRDYVMDSPISHEFYKKLSDMLNFLIPNYIEEGKSSLVIAIGCTGGHHRSVTIANMLYEELSKKAQNCTLLHRDIDKK